MHIKGVLKHIVPAGRAIDLDRVTERMLLLEHVLRQNCDDWDNFKAFAQGVIMRHGEIKKKFNLLVPVSRSATYIDCKDPAGTKAYPSSSELKKERQAIQNRKRAGGTEDNSAASPVKSFQKTLITKKPRGVATEESKQAGVDIQPQEMMIQEERKRPLNRNRRQKPQIDCSTKAVALTASFIRNQ